MKIKYGGHWGGKDVPEFQKEQEYDLTIEQIEELTNNFALKIHTVKIADYYEKYFYLDDSRWSFIQR